MADDAHSTAKSEGRITAAAPISCTYRLASGDFI
jgi:hypothetical protein